MFPTDPAPTHGYGEYAGGTLRLRNGKIWIEDDCTENGVADELLETASPCFSNNADTILLPTLDRTPH